MRRRNVADPSSTTWVVADQLRASCDVRLPRASRRLVPLGDEIPKDVGGWRPARARRVARRPRGNGRVDPAGARPASPAGTSDRLPRSGLRSRPDHTPPERPRSSARPDSARTHLAHPPASNDRLLGRNGDRRELRRVAARSRLPHTRRRASRRGEHAGTTCDRLARCLSAPHRGRHAEPLGARRVREDARWRRHGWMVAVVLRGRTRARSRRDDPLGLWRV